MISLSRMSLCLLCGIIIEFPKVVRPLAPQPSSELPIRASLRQAQACLPEDPWRVGIGGKFGGANERERAGKLVSCPL